MDFIKISEDSRAVTYGYKTDYEDFSIHFDKEMKSVDIWYQQWVFNDEPSLIPQWEKETDNFIKHSAKYGRWQSQTLVTISAKDIEWINEKCKELFG